jgi:hypothetical protein
MVLPAVSASSQVLLGKKSVTFFPLLRRSNPKSARLWRALEWSDLDGVELFLRSFRNFASRRRRCLRARLRSSSGRTPLELLTWATYDENTVWCAWPRYHVACGIAMRCTRKKYVLGGVET